MADPKTQSLSMFLYFIRKDVRYHYCEENECHHQKRFKAKPAKDIISNRNCNSIWVSKHLHEFIDSYRQKLNRYVESNYDCTHPTADDSCEDLK